MLKISALAKINWFLSILGRRDDGYHEISSLMQRITLEDSLTFENAAENSRDIEVATELNIPLQDNLVYKAAVLLRETAGTDSGVRITLKKEIPVSAGLAGGSSDAASALMGLNRFWKLGLSMQKLAELGEGIGSDVPFFFSSPAAAVEGRGEVVLPVRMERSWPLLLVKPSVSVSTAWAYSNAGIKRPLLTKKGNNIKLFVQGLEQGDFTFLSSIAVNDLEPCVVNRYPIIGEIKERLTGHGALFASMSGSGSAVFGVFETEEKAFNAMKALPDDTWCRVVRTVTGKE